MTTISIDILEQFQQVLSGLSSEQYRTPVQVLEGGTIGKHTRHIVELYLCAFQGYADGEVCYDARQRDPLLESDRDAALSAIDRIKGELERPDRDILLTGEFGGQPYAIRSNYQRELLYNLEHCIHHLALIRPALRELGWNDIPESFGVAPSTMVHRKECAR